MTTDPAFELVSEEVAAARDALVEAAQADAGKWWSAYELKIHARNGSGSGAVSLAMNDLVDDGTFELNEDLRVRLRT